ncbi:hypothetical protein SAMN05444374_101434 [Rhodococcoides kroppenstedtii]|uniref:Uncharacterized protein n=1 Tax=Rhodococcoides kroppenstedtii TaxID=293050 RepID=A0A1I0SMW0_9NOCA|nr:hypothetical protein SAMN05444374_101434 [Rhodococcus kroppenstedtii]
MTGPRTLVVRIDSWVIGDGEIAVPRRGEVLAGPLQFIEAGADAPHAVRVRAELVASDRPPVWQYTGEETSRRWEWSGLLRGDGWTASWRGAVPRTGQVDLTGVFWGSFGPDMRGRFRGRVTRVRMASERYERRGAGGWYSVPGHYRLREVDTAPRFFGLGDTEHDGDSADMETSVVVDLDLDNVPALPVRPELVPGDVSVAGGVLWVVDSALPVVLRIDADDRATRVVLPGAIGTPRRVYATPSGCWVTGQDGTFWVTEGADPVRVDDQPVVAGAAAGESLVASTGTAVWRQYSPSREPVDLAAVAGHVSSIVVVDDYVYAAVLPRGRSELHLVRVSSSGECTVGSAIPLVRNRHRKPFLMGDALRLVHGADVGVVESDLSVRRERIFARHPVGGGRTDELSWTVTPTPNGTSAGWWPLPGPVVVDRTRASWVLTVHDSASLEPVTSVPVSTHTARVAAGADGEVFVIDGAVRRFRTDSPVMADPEVIDVAGIAARLV